MELLSLADILTIHKAIIERSGGGKGIRDLGLLESAIAQQSVSFGGKELYPTLVDKAAALCFSVVGNHPFADGNKRVGHASMRMLLNLNGFTVEADVDNAEQAFLRLAAGEMNRDELTKWIADHLVQFTE